MYEEREPLRAASMLKGRAGEDLVERGVPNEGGSIRFTGAEMRRFLLKRPIRGLCGERPAGAVILALGGGVEPRSGLALGVERGRVEEETVGMTLMENDGWGFLVGRPWSFLARLEGERKTEGSMFSESLSSKTEMASSFEGKVGECCRFRGELNVKVDFAGAECEAVMAIFIEREQLQSTCQT